MLKYKNHLNIINTLKKKNFRLFKQTKRQYKFFWRKLLKFKKIKGGRAKLLVLFKLLNRMVKLTSDKKLMYIYLLNKFNKKYKLNFLKLNKYLLYTYIFIKRRSKNKLFLYSPKKKKRKILKLIKYLIRNNYTLNTMNSKVYRKTLHEFIYLNKLFYIQQKNNVNYNKNLSKFLKKKTYIKNTILNSNKVKKNNKQANSIYFNILKQKIKKLKTNINIQTSKYNSYINNSLKLQKYNSFVHLIKNYSLKKKQYINYIKNHSLFYFNNLNKYFSIYKKNKSIKNLRKINTIYVNCSNSNSFITVTDNTGRTYLNTSIGRFVKGKIKKTPFGAKMAARSVAKQLKLGFKGKYYVILQGVSRSRLQMIRQFNRLYVKAFLEKTPIAHNGVRQKKLKRR